MSEFLRTADSFRQGATTLPREFYTSSSIFAEEQSSIFGNAWCCVGRASALPNAGDFITRDIAGESIIVLRDAHLELHALFNVCRHRGTRLCSESAGRMHGKIQCPYHAWTYDLDGTLLGAPHMADVEGFRRADFPLHRAAIAEWNGFIFVSIADSPSDFASHIASLTPRFSRFALERLAVGHSARYEVAANWKLIFQNYSECQHCPMIHPELTRVLPYQSGANDLTEGPFLGGYMEIAPPNDSATLSGGSCGPPISDALLAEDRRRAWYYSILPNLLLSIHPDYVNYYIITPLSVNATLVESEWLFRGDAESANAKLNIDDAVTFWDRTNRQDWDIVEQSQLGVSSRSYTPGPYSPRESIPAAWDHHYLQIMGRRE